MWLTFFSSDAHWFAFDYRDKSKVSKVAYRHVISKLLRASQRSGYLHFESEIYLMEILCPNSTRRENSMKSLYVQRVRLSVLCKWFFCTKSISSFKCSKTIVRRRTSLWQLLNRQMSRCWDSFQLTLATCCLKAEKFDNKPHQRRNLVLSGRPILEINWTSKTIPCLMLKPKKSLVMQSLSTETVISL